MSDKRLGVVVLAVALGGCATVLSSEDRAAACKFAPVSDECRYGYTWRAKAVHDMRVQLDEQAAQEARQRQEAADRAAEVQRQAAAQQAQVEEARRERASRPRYAHRRTETFASFADALDVLDPEGGPAPFDLARSPGAALMRAKGRVFMLDMQVMQVVGKAAVLANPCFMFQGVEDMGAATVCPVLVRLSPGCGGDRDFIDDMRFSGIVEVDGTAQYETAMGVQKTVPQLVAYGVQATR